MERVQNVKRYGKVIGIDEDLVIPNKQFFLYEDKGYCWKGDTMKEWKSESL